MWDSGTGTRKEDVLFSAGVRNVKLGLVGSTTLLLGVSLRRRILRTGDISSFEHALTVGS